MRPGYSGELCRHTHYGWRELKDYRLKLHVNKDVKPVAHQLRRLPFGEGCAIHPNRAESSVP